MAIPPRAAGPSTGRPAIVAGTVTSVAIRALASSGAGVGDLPDGRVVFVQRTAPGDRARVRVTKVRKRWATARLEALIEAGPDRVTPPCGLYTRCGGCTLQHLGGAAQRAWKARFVADALERIGGQAVAVPDVTPSPEAFRYRSRVTFTLMRLKGGRVVAGFHSIDRPGRIVDVHGECLLPESPITKAWVGLRSAWGPGAVRLPAGATLRLTLRATAGGVVLVIAGGSGEGGDAEALVRDTPGLSGVWAHADRSRPPERLAGCTEIVETWLRRSLRVGADTFLQVNRRAAAILHEYVLERVGVGAAPSGGGRAIDAYCGVGAFGDALARAGWTVIWIESNAGAVPAARAAAPEGFEVRRGRVEEVLPALLGEGAAPDVVILNPPRTGLHADVCASLLATRAGRIVYVSCDPATLARDTARLSAGYALSSVASFDLFPQTAHVETVAVLLPLSA